MSQIQEKQKELPEDVGEDFSKAESFHRMHAAFERDISALGKQVKHTGTDVFQKRRILLLSLDYFSVKQIFSSD